jgi:hypothetical protein
MGISTQPFSAQRRSEVFFCFSFDLAITGRVSHAKQGKAFGDLFIVQEALI